MNLQKNWNHPFGGWYEYVTGQKSPNLHHQTENWRETVTNFPFDPLSTDTNLESRKIDHL